MDDVINSAIKEIISNNCELDAIEVLWKSAMSKLAKERRGHLNAYFAIDTINKLNNGKDFDIDIICKSVIVEDDIKRQV